MPSRCKLQDYVGDGGAIILCRVIAVQINEHPWYIGCNKCKKKLIGVDEQQLRGLCEKCNREMSGVRRWILNLQCSDDTGSRLVKMYEECGNAILGMTADEFANESHSVEMISEKLLHKRVQLECKLKKDDCVCEKVVRLSYVEECAKYLQDLAKH